jgi:hypothetical protein
MTKIATIRIFWTKICYKVASGVCCVERINGSPEVALKVDVLFIYKPWSSARTL